MLRRITGVLIMLATYGQAAAASYSPDADRDYPIDVFWGDTHVHTSYSSIDAYSLGDNVVTPTVAYRFARGETVTARNGMQARIRRPLDFLVIADHAEGLGLAYELAQTGAVSAETFGEKLREAYQASQSDPAARQSVWQRVVTRADEHNDPGRFTAFAGYEWSSPGSQEGVFANLHRVVLFRDGADVTGRIVPFSAFDSRNPEDLWAFLDRYKADTGGDVIAIPHNPNLSNGEMFARHQYDGTVLTREWAELRAGIEPLMEVTQLKGDSEAHAVLSPTDEFADFETWHTWAGENPDTSWHPCCAERGEEGWSDARFEAYKRGEYARPALKRGLDIAAELGVNPFKYGLIGSTDAHTSMASADNDNFWGQYPNTPPSGTRPTDQFSRSWKTPFHWETSASGYAAVWARENTRESIFAAMQRREVYATSGPRIVVRFFGGFDYAANDAAAPNIARVGYAKGIPMGADLGTAPRGRQPTFLVAALKDPDGANLDRIQIIKGWRDEGGILHERVFDVALSDDRQVGADGGVEPVGSTVDVAAASYDNSIGDPQLTVVWADTDFDPEERAFYYARVIEIPTPRWPAYDAKHFGVDLPDGVRQVTQERAYTSPIWYEP